MKCPDCEALLQRRLDGEPLPDAAALEQHLAACSSCRERHQDAQLLLDALRAQAYPSAPEGLSRQIVAAVLDERSARLRRRRWWTGIAVAASLLLMALAGYIWFPRDNQEPVPQPFVKKDAPKEEPPSLGQAMEEARAAVTDLTERLADTTKKQARIILAAANPMELAAALPAPRPPEMPAEAARSLQQTTQGVGDGLQAVASSARRAVNFLAREVAALEPSMRN